MLPDPDDDDSRKSDWMRPTILGLLVFLVIGNIAAIIMLFQALDFIIESYDEEFINASYHEYYVTDGIYRNFTILQDKVDTIIEFLGK